LTVSPGGALDANEGEPGSFYIQGDHTGGLKFRNITVSLPKREPFDRSLSALSAALLLFISRLFVKRIAAGSSLPKLPTHREIEDVLVRERIHDVLSFPFAAYDIVRTQYSEVAHDHSPGG
jgi:hypothetical protein